MNPKDLGRTILLTLACAALLAGLTACGGRNEAEAPQWTSKPLSDQIQIAFKPHLFDTNGFLRPYETCSIFLSGPGVQSFSVNTGIRVDADSRRDGVPLADDRLQHLQLGRSTFENEHNLRLSPTIYPGAMLPRQPGTYTYDLVLQVGCEKWICPPSVVQVRASEKEIQQISLLEQWGASRFLDHPLGARRASEGDTPGLPYEALSEFVNAHPDSYLTKVIKARIQSLFMTDINSCSPYTEGPLLKEDQQALATLIGSVDPQFINSASSTLKNYEKILTQTKKPEQVQQQIDVIQSWIQAANAAKP